VDGRDRAGIWLGVVLVGIEADLVAVRIVQVGQPDSLPPLRQAQVAQTEERIVAAATELFLGDGYTATTLEAVARRARVGARTVYLRFGTKAAAETYLLITRMLGWDLDTYQEWLATTGIRCAARAGGGTESDAAPPPG
jgi:AcrR family transcriptional regulator